ncbi:MAG: radical SAM protein [Deltaproteobacteria bacterium]|nr:radical SAM protein [Deltaproteobacteria bacterium]
METSHRTKGILRLTMACNERCPFCNVPVEDYAEPTPQEEATMRELDAFVEAGEQTLTISGGEPTLLRKRLLRVVRAARERGIPNVEIQTNAVLVDDAYARELREAGVTSAFVSLLSHVAAHHDVLAGLDGAFDKCLQGIDALFDAGIEVTLNLVVARRTQLLLAGYVRFVARRLPRVQSISLSAVQPHGRAARDAELLPDYDLLGPRVREALDVADAHGLRVLNPYCGLPACVGWDDHLAWSVEAIEARQGGWRSTPGIENTGDKIHGPPCKRCTFRPVCGGAWRAYWEERGGAGIQTPSMLVEPWEGSGPDQSVARRLGPHNEPVTGTTPTVWFWTDRLQPGDEALPFTHLALELNAARIAVDQLRLLRHLSGRPVHVGLRVGGDPLDLGAILHVLAGLGVATVALIGPPQWAPMEIALRSAFPRLDVRRVDPPARG